MSERLSEHLSLIPIFSKLQPDELAVLEDFMFFSKAQPGDFIFREGEKGDRVCFVVSGSLDVIKLNQEAQPVVITRLARGSSIGEMVLLDNLTRSASVRATAPATLIVLTREKFDSVLATHPVVGIKILKGIALLLSINLRKTSDRLAEFMPSLA